MRDLAGVPGLPPLEELLADDDEAKARAARREAEKEKQAEIARRRVACVDALGRAYGTGRRKTSVARVWLRKGSGGVVVNGQPLDLYFPDLAPRAAMLEPFVETGTAGVFDVKATVKGGGVSGQAGAMRHGISRALQQFDPTYRPALKSAGLLTRDSRMVERKKPGKAKARKSFQWVHLLYLPRNSSPQLRPRIGHLAPTRGHPPSSLAPHNPHPSPPALPPSPLPFPKAAHQLAIPPPPAAPTQPPCPHLAILLRGAIPFLRACACAQLQATPAAVAAIQENFSGAVEEAEFIDTVAEKLREHGFNRDNSIALVSTCRDEASRFFDALIDKHFGLVFSLAGLAGVPPGGVLAVKAGTSHSPQDENGRERYVFFGFTHIGVDERGTVGKMRRGGRANVSGACGALAALTAQFSSGTALGEADEEDMEVFLLSKKLRAKEPEPTLVAVTKAAVEVINETIEKLIATAVDTSKADYAVITGVQIHSSCHVQSEEAQQAAAAGGAFQLSETVEYIAPSLGYVVVQGEKTPLRLNKEGWMSFFWG
ncbi:unnamed protein product [Closterium sp. NIES-64]|nr:unnamed protein product [Closterium sp. NIES-64]